MIVFFKWTIPHTAAIRSQCEIEGKHKVVLQVLSNWEVDLSFNAILAKDFGFSDPRQLEELWSLVGS